MNRYQFNKQLGDGTYGSVILATTMDTKEKVAIKRCLLHYITLASARYIYIAYNVREMSS